MFRKPAALLCAGSFLFLTACEPVQPLSEYRPAVDPGKTNQARYEKDLQACRAVALQVEADYKERQQKEMGKNLAAGLIVGALVGAAAGTNTGYRNDYILTGAAVGAAAGAGSGDYDHDLVTYGPRRVVDRCMAGRGYTLLTDFGRG